MKFRTFALASSALAITVVLAGCSTPPGGMDMNHSPTLSADSSPTAKFGLLLLAVALGVAIIAVAPLGA